MNCVCGRARCGSKNLDRWYIGVTRNEVEPHYENADLRYQWYSRDGTGLCSDMLENAENTDSPIISYRHRLRVFWSRFARKFKPTKREFLVVNRGRSEGWSLYLAGVTQIDEHENYVFNPGSLIQQSTAVGGQRPPEPSQWAASKLHRNQQE